MFSEIVQTVAGSILLILTAVSLLAAGGMTYTSIKMRRASECTHEYMVEGLFLGLCCVQLGIVFSVAFGLVSGLI